MCLFGPPGPWGAYSATSGYANEILSHGADNTADVLTKPLVKVVHEKHVANLLMDKDGAE